MQHIEQGYDRVPGAVSNHGYSSNHDLPGYPDTDLWENNTTTTDFFCFSYELSFVYYYP